MVWMPPSLDIELPKWEVIEQKDLTVSIKRRKLHEKQIDIVKAFYDDRVFIMTAACGRRFGKSRLVFEIMIESIRRGESVLWTMPKWDNFADLIDEFHAFFGEAIIQSNRKQHLYKMVSGSYIKFSACWNQETTLGRGYDFKVAIMDEAAAISRIDGIIEKNIKPTMSVRKAGWGKPKILLISSPMGVGNYFEQKFVEGGGIKDQFGCWFGENNHASARFASWHNPFVDKEFLDMERKAKSPDAFAQEYEAAFLERGGELVTYEMFHRIKWDGKGDIFIGVDLANEDKPDSDYSAFVAVAKHPDGRIFVLGAQRVKHKLPQHTLDALTDFVETMSMLTKKRPKLIAVEVAGSTTGKAEFILSNAKGLPVIKSKLPSKASKGSKIMLAVGKYSAGLMCHPDPLRDLEYELVAFNGDRNKINNATNDLADALVIAMYDHITTSSGAMY